MYFPSEDLKVNKFKLVYIPKNRDYMSRLGSVTVPPSAYSGDEEVHRQQNKVEDLEYYSRYAQMKAQEAEKKNE